MDLRAGLSRQIALFAVFGVVQLVVDWLTFVILTWAGLHVGVSNVCGRVVGAVVGFWLNGRFTFAASGGSLSKRRMQAFRFVAGWVMTAALSTTLVWLVEQQLGLQAAWAAKLAIDVVVAALGFVLSKYWIFR